MKVQTHVRRLAAPLLCASTLLAGCSGGAGLPQVHKSAAGKATAQAAFTIHWPAHAVSTASTRSPKFISPNAMAVVVEVNPNAAIPGKITFSGKPVIVNHPDGTTTSTVSIDAPVGSDEFVFTLWDTPQVAGETQPVGNQLGQADVVQTIVANQTNTVNAVIGGITSHIAIAPLPNQPLVETDAGLGYDLVGDMPATFVATPQDADGNAIVAPGAPTLSVAASGSYASYLNVQPVNGNPSQFTVASTKPFAAAQVAAQNYNSALNPLGVVVTATDAGVPHTATANLNVWQRSAMYVSYQGTGGAGAGIALYDDQGDYIPLPAGAFAGLNTPAGVAYDTLNHQVYVADTGANAIMAFDAMGNPVASFPLAVPGSLPGARGIAYDPQSDTLFATGYVGTTGKVLAFKADGTSAFLIPSPFSKTTMPNAVAYISRNTSGPDDEIAIGNDSTKAIDYYYPNGAWIRSDTLKAPTKTPPLPPLAAPIVGLAFNTYPALTPSQLFATGGPAGSGFAVDENLGGGFSLDYLSSTASRYGGVAISNTFVHAGNGIYGTTPYEVYLVLPDTNQIQAYLADFGQTVKFNFPDIVITAPPSTGLSNPMGIAITGV